MAEKIDLDATMKKVEGVTKVVDVIMRNKLIIAVLLVVDGITFMLNPNSTLEGMAKNIIFLVIIAALSNLIANLTAKPKNKKSIIMTVIVLVLGAFFYFYPDFIAAYIQLLLALFIIYSGVTNIGNALHLDSVSKISQVVFRKYSEVVEKTDKEELKDVNKNFDEGLEEQTKKLISPLSNMVEKADKASTLYIVVNAASVALGIILLIFPDVSMMIWGLIFLYTGMTNLIAAMRSMHVMKKVREGKLKEILYDAEGEVAGVEEKEAKIKMKKEPGNKVKPKKSGDANKKKAKTSVKKSKNTKG